MLLLEKFKFATALFTITHFDKMYPEISLEEINEFILIELKVISFGEIWVAFSKEIEIECLM